MLFYEDINKAGNFVKFVEFIESLVNLLIVFGFDEPYLLPSLKGFYIHLGLACQLILNYSVFVSKKTFQFGTKVAFIDSLAFVCLCHVLN